MTRAISMRDLQKLSAGAIQALPHAVPIKNGTATVGVLLPVQSASKEYLREVLARIDAAAAQRTPEEDTAIDRLLAERAAE
ncbi:MAG TPA: hypothetical protein VF744_17950 [Beijerinckiaceae bacterium]|jgi:hypothetical protein